MSGREHRQAGSAQSIAEKFNITPNPVNYGRVLDFYSGFVL